MLEMDRVTKRFEERTAVREASFHIAKGSVCGLVGSNGAGKSTLMRLLSGVYQPDSGTVALDGIPVFNCPKTKEMLVFVPDELFFLPGADLWAMAKFYSAGYRNFSMERFGNMAQAFGLSLHTGIHSFSKGMKRQAAAILALSCRADYVLLDEIFDGLDVVMRNLIRKVIYADICERQMTVLITSHSLRELEDTCDKLILVHDGRVILEQDLEEAKTGLTKLQISFPGNWGNEKLEDLEVLQQTRVGSVATVILRGDAREAAARLQNQGARLCEELPVTLEELFLCEMEVRGYTAGGRFLETEEDANEVF